MTFAGRCQPLLLSRLVLTTLWLSATLAAVQWHAPFFWRPPPDRASTYFDVAMRLASNGRSRAALEAVHDALAVRPDEPGYLAFAGYRELDVARPAAAAATFRRALAIRPRDQEARLGLASAFARTGRRDQALSTLDGIALDALSPQQLRRRSQLYGMLGAYGASFKDLRELLGTAPTDDVLLDEASTMALAAQEWAAAAAISERLAVVTDHVPLKRRAWNRKGQAERSLGHLRQAYRAYQQAETAENLDARAQLAMQLGDFETASRLYDVLQQERPGDVEIRRQLAYALDRATRYGAAERHYRALVEEGAADTATRQRLAYLLNAQHRYADAWEVLAVIPRRPITLDLLGLEARTAAWAGDAHEAVPLLQAVLAQRPQDAECWKLLADGYRVLGDEPQRAHALRSYVRLRSQDRSARQTLADVLARLGRIDDAIEEYELLLTSGPREEPVVRSLALLLETKGKLPEATSLYLEANAVAPAPSLWLRIARLYRWQREPGAAIEWYQRYLAAPDDALQHGAAGAEMALAWLDAGDAAASLAAIEQLAEEVPLDADALLTAARAATATHEPAAAADYLQRLSDARPLDVSEQIWFAGQLRAAGRIAGALSVYERLIEESVTPDGTVLEAAGDLLVESGQPGRALEIYQRLNVTGVITRKMARAAAAIPDVAAASRAYALMAQSGSSDLEEKLEAARFFAQTGQPQSAVPAYQAVVAGRSAEGIRLELAHVHLEAEDFRGAEHWARDALAAGEDPTGSAVALAQSLHLDGRSVDARHVLGAVRTQLRSQPDGFWWLGQAAFASNRHLEAFRAFDDAIAAGMGPKDELWLWRGHAAAKRGDYHHAADSYAHVDARGRGGRDLETAQRDLRRATAIAVEVPMIGGRDSNGLSLAQTGIAASASLPRNWARVSGAIRRGDVRQHDYSVARTVTTVAVDRLFPMPALQLRLGIGQEASEHSSRLTVMRAAAHYAFSDSTMVGVEATRESLLSTVESDDRRAFNRIVDLRGIGGVFAVTRFGAVLESAAGSASRIRASGGVESLQDDNQRRFSYVHYEWPLRAGAGQWIVLRPNASVETFLFPSAFYFSPRRHVTLGTMVYSIVTIPRWTFEVEVNPQILRTDGATGFGAHGMTRLTRHFGRIDVEGHTFILLDDLRRYRNWQVGLRLNVPVSR